MKIPKIISQLLPPPYVVALCLVAPLIFTVYFLVTHYRNDFIKTEAIDYFTIQQDFLGRLFIEQQWVAWLDTFVNFAFWGVLASIFLIIVWAVGAARITVSNHEAIENFQNFKVPRASWHGQFIITASLKVLLVGVGAYLFILILIKAIPNLSLAAQYTVVDQDIGTIINLLVTGFYLVLLQLGIIVSIRLFRQIAVE